MHLNNLDNGKTIIYLSKPIISKRYMNAKPFIIFNKQGN